MESDWAIQQELREILSHAASVQQMRVDRITQESKEESELGSHQLEVALVCLSLGLLARTLVT